MSLSKIIEEMSRAASAALNHSDEGYPAVLRAELIEDWADRLSILQGELVAWVSTSDKLPELGVWVVGKRGNHRPFTCRWVEIQNDMYKGTACMDADNNYRDPEIWAAIPDAPSPADQRLADATNRMFRSEWK